MMMMNLEIFLLNLLEAVPINFFVSFFTIVVHRKFQMVRSFPSLGSSTSVRLGSIINFCIVTLISYSEKCCHRRTSQSTYVAKLGQIFHNKLPLTLYFVSLLGKKQIHIDFLFQNHPT